MLKKGESMAGVAVETCAQGGRTIGKLDPPIVWPCESVSGVEGSLMARTSENAMGLVVKSEGVGRGRQTV